MGNEKNPHPGPPPDYREREKRRIWDCRASDYPDSASRRGDAGFYLRIAGYFKADRWLIAALVGLIWLALAVGACGPAVFALLTDTVLTGKTGTGFVEHFLLPILPTSGSGQIVLLALLWMLLLMSNDTLTLFREMINNRLRYNGTARIRCDLFDHLLRLNPSYHKNRPQGDSLYRLSTDTLGFFGVINTFIGAANSLLTFFVVGAVMIRWNVKMTLVTMALSPLLIIANTYFGKTIRRSSAVSKQIDSDLLTFIQRTMSSIGLIQLCTRQHDESAGFRGSVAKTVDAGMSMSWQQQLYPLAQRIIYGLGYGFILGYGALLVHHDQAHQVANAFTVGGILAMTFYLGQLWEPLRRITGFFADMQTDAAACARVFQVLNEKPTVQDCAAARKLPVRSRTLELSGVSFGYSADQTILRGVDARIEPGQLVAFVGPSGAGKSTLVGLLPRLYDPRAGSLSLDGYDLRDLRLADVRSHIALVPQDSPMIAGTLAENVAFGRPLATPAQIIAAAKLAGAAAFIEEFPAGYATVVTEGGQNLSGGQRQRVAIARALLTEAPILILDEPTSGLDTLHERKIMETLHAIKGHHTVILVTHSLNAVTGCDHIFVMDHGQIAEQGTHEELLAKSGLYANMLSVPHLHVEEGDVGAAA
jgi:subfamily B ATP-binding cassette protein MsbA